MAQGNHIDEKGNIFLRQGDTFELVLDGLSDDQNYRVFFAAQDAERNPIGNEIEVETKGATSVTIFLDAGFTDLLTVEEGAKAQIYYYGVKMCSDTDNTEDTLLLGNSTIGGLNIITVFPRKVEGIINGVGLILLLLLMAVITVKDVWMLIFGG
jgi:hypothetical protein